MPGGEDEDAGEVVIVPAHFLFAEETNDFGGGVRDVGGVHEEKVIEGGDVEEDGFVVKEEFGEEGEVLSEKLVLFAVDFVNGVKVA